MYEGESQAELIVNEDNLFRAAVVMRGRKDAIFTDL